MFANDRCSRSLRTRRTDEDLLAAMRATIPTTMPAVVTMGHGGLEQLVYHHDWPVPRPGRGEVLIAVHACGMNNTDINTRVGWYSKRVSSGTTAEGGARGFAGAADSDAAWGGTAIRFPRIQGADICGRVVDLGDDAPGELLGKRVLVDPWLRDPADPFDLDAAAYLGSERDGGYAHYTTAPATNIHPIDSPLSDVELATFPTSYVTAENMLRRAAVGSGDVVLVTGASGGVGTALLQLVRRRGATPVGVAGAEKAKAVRAAGASAVIPRDTSDLAAALQAATGSATVDVVADVVGGASFMTVLSALRRGGRYTCAGAIAGPIVELDLRTFYLNDLTLTGATMTPLEAFGELVEIVEHGELRPLVAAVYPLERLQEAQVAFLEKRHVGNIVIEVGAPAT